MNEALVQSARFEDIRRQIRLGLVSHAEANLTQNQIRAGLLDLLREIEKQGAQEVVRKEMEQAISIVNSKNVLIGSTITSGGGDVQIGDRTINTESDTSRRL
ncbi:MAG: NB-ARC domain-containing protein, partial [Saprospiraceae bacterium]|nr:NB-ARC domain-containing protein [Saprospiraceae bacterium]